MFSFDLKFSDNSFWILFFFSSDNSFEEISFAFNSPFVFETKLKKLSIILSKKNSLFLLAIRPKNFLKVCLES